MKQIIILIIGLVIIGGCKNDSPSELITLPSNLIVNTTISQDGSGKVSVVATADNSNFFTVYFGETTSDYGVVAIDGKASHTYSSSGTFTLKVRANVTQADYITDISSVYVALASSNGVTIPTTGATSPATYGGMTLLWADEFTGTSLNSNYWKHELGAGGWGNNELQFYRQENTQVYNGYLIITAKKETYQGSNYTSSRIITSGLEEFKYGRVDIRAALPKGQGIWPALWMLGANYKTVAWPGCGEIDIMEMIGGSGRENTVFGTAHWLDANNTHAQFSKSVTLSSGAYSDEFHVYSVIWTSTSVKWLVDNVQYHSVDTTPSALSEFQNNFFLLFNVAVGGDLPGAPNSSSIFPQNLIVDYVRVFQ